MNQHPIRHAALALAVLAAAALSASCASVAPPRAEVRSFGAWPAARMAGLFVFDRLPSLQASGAGHETLERAALPALQAAGFELAAPGREPDALVQVDAQVTISPNSLYGRYPFGMAFGFGGWGWRHSWMGMGWQMAVPISAQFSREALVVIRDRASGAVVYEARASDSSFSDHFSTGELQTLFRLALRDFPQTNPQPRVLTDAVPAAAASAPAAEPR